ncbi:hypothetical protein ACJDU8_21475 [Clostridium sp. WILCCON 0269]|uniref:HD domain-containing protein n=1 Tax=Candidatus Clostridium eludens TaxID=3381663 RepID=A0ABW8SSE2_9CLOT
MRQNINKVLLNHFSNGGGAAAYLRGVIPSLTEDVEKLFSTRSDINRIKVAELLSEKILSLTDFSDLIPLRDEVATLEIKRLINYRKQTDHTAHTVYLFLLGIWVYDNNHQLRKMVDDSIKSNKTAKMFIFQWIFASLLHDVGYLFFDYKNTDNKDSWGKFDDMFKAKYIPDYLSKRIEKNKDTFQMLCKEFVEKYNPKLVHSDKLSTKALLDQLNSIPWIEDIIGEKLSGLQVLLAHFDINKELINFAEDIAIKGYDGKGDNPQIDHAIASGLMLLKYTSVWYWLYKKAKEEYPDLHEELNSNYRYPKEVFINHVIPACRAVIYHNIVKLQCDYNKEPLLYLAILCDELQFWDRFWSGPEYIDNWKNVNHCMAEQVYANVISNEFYEEQLHILMPKEQYNKLSSTLKERLNDYGRFVKLTELG